MNGLFAGYLILSDEVSFGILARIVIHCVKREMTVLVMHTLIILVIAQRAQIALLLVHNNHW